MSNENNSDEIPVEVTSEDKIETNNSEEESKHTDNVEQNSVDLPKLLELEQQKVSQFEEKLKHVLADFQNLSRKTQSDIEHVIPIEALGEIFDPNFHEAISIISDPTLDDNTITKEIRKGYISHERIISPTLVEISKKEDNDKND